MHKQNQLTLNSIPLEKARQYIDISKEVINKMEKPVFHITGDIGWINDPNGFSYYNNLVHLFYQYYPYDVKWGPMHWGHVVSKNMIQWEARPVALAPDEEYDMGGCFSGSGIEVSGKHILIYTGHTNPEPDHPEKIRQVQCIALGDGTDYQKINENPVIDTSMIPAHSSLSDFRDPKIFKHENYYYTLVCSRDEDGSGKIIMYRSSDLTNWQLQGTLCKSNNKIGRMWECPDLFQLGGKEILILSVQEVKREEYRFHNGNGTIYAIGQMDYEKSSFEYTFYDELDFGLDFYAPQTIEHPDGRRIMIAWMQSWDRNIPSDQLGWTGMMTLPRELNIINDRLYQNPVKELDTFRKNHVFYTGVLNEEKLTVNNIYGRCIDLIVEVEINNIQKFYINLLEDAVYKTVIQYDKNSNTVTFDREHSGSSIESIHSTTVKLLENKNYIKLRLIIDKFSIEVFINDGERVMSNTVYTPLSAQGISSYALGSGKITMEKWDIVLE